MNTLTSAVQNTDGDDKVYLVRPRFRQEKQDLRHVKRQRRPSNRGKKDDSLSADFVAEIPSENLKNAFSYILARTFTTRSISLT